MLLQLLHDTPLLELVHLDHGREQVEVVARVRSELFERERIFWKTGAAVANPRAQEVWSEAMVEPDPLRNFDDVRTDRLAHVRNLGDERDPGHEKCIRGELDHLGRRDVRPQYWRLDSPVERLDRRTVLVREGTDDDPVRIEEVVHSVTFGQELRIRHVADIREPAAVEGSANLLTCSDRHGRFHHQDLAPRLAAGKVVESRPHERQIRVARIRRRRLDADEQRIRVRQLVRVERVPDAVAVSLEHLRKISLVERHPAGAQRFDPVRHDVAHDHLVTKLGETAARDETDPASAENADLSGLRHDPEAYLGSGVSPRAIASIVSLESSSRIVLMTQYVAPSFRSTTMCRCAPE